MATSQLYRNTTIGRNLQESLDEMIKNGKITKALAAKVLLQYDQSMCEAFDDKSKKSEVDLKFSAKRVRAYRHSNNVWTMLLENVDFKADQNIPSVDKLKIVASDTSLVARKRKN